MKKNKITRKERREQMEQTRLSEGLIRVIRRFFPDLWKLLKEVKDPRHQSYITYDGCTLMMVRILSAIFYISSMRKSSEELNTNIAIKNISAISRQELEEIPYWETINNYLKRVDSSELQEKICQLVRHLIRSRAFEDSKIRGQYWQILIDGSGLISSRKELNGKYTFKVHNKGTADEWIEYCYYVLEAKLVLRSNIIVSIMTEFVENDEEEYKKQDCERKASLRLMKRLRDMFPHLPLCITGDSLYACETFFRQCLEYKWKYLVRYKAGSIPSVQQEFDSLKKIEQNERHLTMNNIEYQLDYVNGIDYRGILLNYAYCVEKVPNKGETTFIFLTNMPITEKNIFETIQDGRRRWMIENQGFNSQKNHGFNLEHLFSRDYQAMKNHYYLIQIAHIISQIMDAWTMLWKKLPLSNEQKHRRLLESWKTDSMTDFILEDKAGYQIRFE